MEAVRDLGIDAQEAAEAHFAAVVEAYWEQEQGEEVETPAYAPFDNCDTCVVREILWSGWEVLEGAVREPLEKILELPPLSMFEAKRIAREALASFGERDEAIHLERHDKIMELELALAAERRRADALEEQLGEE